MSFVVMQQREPGQFTFPEMRNDGSVPEYASRAEAERNAESLGGIANGFRAEPSHEADLLYQYGVRQTT